jgi:hypothetical protein
VRLPLYVIAVGFTIAATLTTAVGGYVGWELGLRAGVLAAAGTFVVIGAAAITGFLLGRAQLAADVHDVFPAEEGD